MKLAWLLAHSAPAFPGLLTLSFTLSSRSLTHGGLCSTSTQPWISSLVFPPHTSAHSQREKQCLPDGTPLPLLTFLDPYSHPHPPFPHSAQQAAFPFLCNYRRAVGLAPGFMFKLNHGCQAATPWLPETLLQFTHSRTEKPPSPRPGVLAHLWDKVPSSSVTLGSALVLGCSPATLLASPWPWRASFFWCVFPGHSLLLFPLSQFELWIIHVFPWSCHSVSPSWIKSLRHSLFSRHLLVRDRVYSCRSWMEANIYACLWDRYVFSHFVLLLWPIFLVCFNGCIFV